MWIRAPYEVVEKKASRPEKAAAFMGTGYFNIK